MLVRFLLLVILGLVLARALRGMLASALASSQGPPRRTPPGPSRGVKMVRDPVCGTFVVPSDALAVSERGTVHYFCSEACREKHRLAARGSRR